MVETGDGKKEIPRKHFESAAVVRNAFPQQQALATVTKPGTQLAPAAVVAVYAVADYQQPVVPLLLLLKKERQHGHNICRIILTVTIHGNNNGTRCHLTPSHRAALWPHCRSRRITRKFSRVTAACLRTVKVSSHEQSSTHTTS